MRLSWGALSRLALGAVIATLSHGASAQTPPDAGALLQQIEQQRQRSEPLPVFKKPEPSAPEEFKPVDPKAAVQIDVLRFEGVHAISEASLQKALGQRIGQALDYAAMQSLARAVGEFYRAQGLWAKAILPPQRLDQGVLVLRVYEGQLGSIIVEPGVAEGERLRLAPKTAEAFITRSQAGLDTFNIDRFQEAIKRLDSVPGIKAAGILKTGQDLGQTDVRLRLANAPVASGSVGLDNNGSRSTGYLGANAALSLDSPLGLGEQFTFSLSKTEGVRSLSAGASVLLNPLGTRLGLNLSDMHYAICCGPLTSSAGRGESQGATLTLTHPLAMRDDWTSTAVFTLAHRSNYNDTNGGITSDKTQDVATAAWQMAWPDQLGLGGVNRLNLTYTLGRMDLGGNPEVAQNAMVDATAAGVNGTYHKLQVNLSRQQTLGPQTQLSASLLAQAAFDNLDSGEKISLGGSSSVRAFPGGEGSGDSGAVMTLELRQSLSNAWQGSAFYDYGYVRVNQNPWAGWNAGAPSLRNHYQLRGLGLGATWQGPQGLRVSTAVARRLGANPGADAKGNDGDGTHRLWRVWFNLSKAY